MFKYIFFFISLVIINTPQLLGQEDKEGTEREKKEKKDPYKDLQTHSVINEGLFNVIQKKGKIYFEIPHTLLNKKLLIVSRIKGHVKGLNFGGAGMRSRPQQVIRWELVGDQVLLRRVSYDAVADTTLPIYQSVENNNFDPVILTFEKYAVNPDSTATVIDVTPMFTTDVPMIGAVNSAQSKKFGLKGVDQKRSIVTSVSTFPQNVEVRHILTYKGGEDIPDNKVTETLSVEMNQSFVALPEVPMQPRFYDSRVGYFSISRINYGLNAQKAKDERLITRWRLEPVDMEAWKRGELVEVKKPIIYYIDPSTPEQWREPIKQGVNDWQKAFEKIGFKNAIMAKDPPTKEEDPDWSPEDVRYSVIRYVSTDIQNAMGPHVHDPRTGEILESDIIWYHNVMNLLRNWYLIQTSAVNPEARGIGFKEEVMGQLIRFVSAHEVGHTLGLPHNMGSSAAYSVDSLRAPGYVQKNGTAPSIMDYARFNYVAQPEDKGAGLHPKIGVYDDWAIKYGYQPIPEASTAEDEKPILNSWIKEKAENKVYRYGRQRQDGFDPSAQTEDLGSDPVYASTLGVKNLQRILPNLIEWTSQKGENYEELEELYNQIFVQLNRYAGHIVTNIGGVYEHQRSSDEKKKVYEIVSKDRQEACMQFLNKHIFSTPKWIISQDILMRISPSGIAKRIESQQQRTLKDLFKVNRLNRLAEQGAVDKSNYQVEDLFKQSYQHIYRKNEGKDIYERTLQRLYVIQLGTLLYEDELNVDAKAMIRSIFSQIRSKYQNIDLKKPLTFQEGHKAELLRLMDLALNGEGDFLKKTGAKWEENLNDFRHPCH